MEKRPLRINWQLLKKSVIFLAVLLGLYTIGLGVVYFSFSDNLPDIDELETFKPKRITKVFSADGQHLKNFLEENRETLSASEIPQSMKDALTSIEDRRFYSHWGIDIRRIFGAMLANIRKRDMTAQGASTLTQQLARNLYEKVGKQRSSETFDKLRASYARKIREQITAVHIERLYTKEEILTMYLNTVHFGHGRDGLKTAARYYFNKEVPDLAVEECAMLAGLLKAPATYSPFNNEDRAIGRRNIVLDEMVSSGKLSTQTYQVLHKQPIRVQRGQLATTYDLGPYFMAHVRQQLDSEFGASLKRDGLRVITTLDSRLQRIAEKHFATEIGEVQERVDKYLERKKHDPDLPDSAVVQAAFVAMDPRTGHILAMIGGRDFNENKFNRATQAQRPPGSSFKPFVYTAALDNGRFPTDMLDDNAITIKEINGEIWDPKNYDKKFKGPMTLREGLKQSRNLISIKLAMEVGPKRIARYARNMGITTNLEPVYSLGIGTSAVRLLDLVSAYCVFPNKGIYVEPVAIKQIFDHEGNLIFQPVGNSREVLRPSVAALMTDLMRSVIDESGGTGHRIRFRYNFTPQAAGKTGTTNNYADAWFVGFTPHLVAGVWVGMDNPSLSLWPRQAGSVAALPLWARFMQEVYTTVDPYRSLAAEKFDYSEDLLVEHTVCSDTHKLATRYCPRQTEGLFIKDGILPNECPRHSKGKTQKATRNKRF